ncbi:MAG: hypothetical protein KTR30_34820 [Saprospiraceae bacterium]|nr:hypothetical protein [Saprospiraceae bacterium]
MKKSIFYTLPLLLALVFSSCAKNNEGPAADDGLFVTCTMNGEEFKAEGTYAYAVDWDDSYNVYGLTVDDITMYVAIDQGITDGTHAFNEETTFAIISREGGKSYSTLFEGGEGQVTVTERTATTVKGSFKFTAIETNDSNEKLVVENGKFQVQFR